MEKVKVGAIYRHFKGQFYVIRGFAYHSETLEQLVLYQELKEKHSDVWARPIKMFVDHIDREDYKGPRFLFQIMSLMSEDYK